ncbi:MAG: GAF domain-containing protein [Acidobacteriia bacterium]|nr:GAF domain-containing protein [Terriglobia bacterium]
MVPEIPPAADLMTDRRKHLRRLTVKELIGLQLGVGNRGIVVDLSEGGMRVQAASRVHLLPASLLRFQVPGCSAPVAASCEVAWADDFGKAGLRFTGFSGNSLHDLRRWLTTTTAPVLVEKKEGIRAQARALPLPIPKPQVVTASAGQRSAPLQVALPQTLPGEDARPAPSSNSDTFEARLHALAQNLITLTAADGAVVALRSGTEIVCRASVGVAPPVGAPFQQDSGLAGECVRKGVVVWCPDTNDDARVNREACQRLNLRATVLAPIVRAGGVQGVLEVFSSRPHIFDRGDVMAMTRLADIVAGLLEKQEAKPSPEKIAVPAVSSAGQRLTPPQVVTGAAPVVAPPAAPQTIAQPAARPTREAALRLPQPENGILKCDACGHPNPECARVCENCDVPLRVPELEALLDKSPRVSKLLLAAFMIVAPLGCFYAGHEMGVLMRKPAVQKSQPANTDVVRPEVAKQM